MTVLLCAASVTLAEPVRVQPVAEIGSLLVAVNDLQLGTAGTPLDLRSEAGQDRLFPTLRARLDLQYGRDGRGRVSVIYQPFELSTRAVPQREWRVRDVTFAPGTPVEVDFGFSFFRASWQYDVLPDEATTLGLGVNLQLRSSSLVFFAADGSAGTSQQEFGPVPSVLVRLRRDGERAWVEAELSALPAPFENPFDGFYELDLRVGTKDPRGFEPYLVLRGLGGGFEGMSDGALSASTLLAFSLGVGAALR